MTYEEFKMTYTEYFYLMMRYSPDQIGSRVYSERMAELSDEYPEFEERLLSEIEAQA